MIKTKTKRSIKGLLIAVVLAFANSVAAQGFSKLVVFGDSLSDTGNLASISVNFPFPFFENRISNGPVLVDFLAAQVASNADASKHLIGNPEGFNYSVAGGNVVGSDVEDLAPQVDAYLGREQADPQALYFILMGGNDLRDIRSITSQALVDARINEVLDTLVAQINRLAGAGATTFLISNLPDIGRLPQTIERESTEPGVIARARQYSILYNQRLVLRLAALRSALDVDISEFDLFSEFELLFVNPQQFGFTQTEVGCFELDSFSFEPECVFGTRFDRFVFFDSIHPTAKTNELIAAKLAQIVPESFFIPNDGEFITLAPILQLLLD